MDSLKIFAADINNLTDARYFAAWGIKWMSFYISKAELNEAGIQKYTEIKDWLEGPKFAAGFAHDISPEEMMEFAAAVGLDGVIADASRAEMLSSFPGLIQIILETKNKAELLDSASETIIIRAKGPGELADIPFEALSDYEIYIDMEINPTLLTERKDLLALSGLVLRGGEEEKIGYKSFDDLDEIFETIESVFE